MNYLFNIYVNYVYTISFESPTIISLISQSINQMISQIIKSLFSHSYVGQIVTRQAFNCFLKITHRLINQVIN